MIRQTCQRLQQFNGGASGFIFSPTQNLRSLPIHNTEQRFPILRVFCVAKNYRAHALEMGANPDREPPCFFSKSAQVVVDCGSSSNVQIPYPTFTSNLHYEGELVVAIGEGGSNIPEQSSLDFIYGYAAGVDLTCRDIQAQCKDAGKPWESAKAFDNSAPIGPLVPINAAGDCLSNTIELKVNGVEKQKATLDQMIWSVPEIISKLSTQFSLYPGDLIFTGTPAGVGPLQIGDEVVVSIQNLPDASFRIVK
mmetsp:Transcript_29807/g.38338  ORF Transcript_29807/g.38338 Transcript_29807/m.38338 type:complete len:251 (-) Transcript_29807:59-811(-)